MLARARELERVDEFMTLLTVASRFRHTFESRADAAAACEPVRLAQGPLSPSVICLPSVLATSGPHQYARFAKAFRESRELAVLPLPGFLSGERVPASMAAAVRAHGEAVCELTDGRPFVLAGHSTGGLLAYALASWLESNGVNPAGVLLIDTQPLQGGFSEILREVIDRMLEQEDMYVAANDVRLTAMGAYLELLVGWQPAEIAAPTLLLRAAESMTGMKSEHEWRASWPCAHVAADIRGDHFTMMEEHADIAAQEAQSWLLETLGDREVV
jgi:thioesterase domain-containing protein